MSVPRFAEKTRGRGAEGIGEMKKQQAGQILSGLFCVYGFLRSRVGGLGKELLLKAVAL